MLTKSDLKNLERIFATKEDLRVTTDQLIKLMTENFSTLIERLDEVICGLQSHRIVLGNHENRLQKVETEIFSPS